MTISLDFRKDNRSTEVFQQNIAEFTQREQIYAEALRLDMQSRLKKEIKIRNNGVDNSGGLIEGNLHNHNVDMCFDIDGKDWYFEIKTAPEYCDSFYTFKVYSLQQTLLQNAKLVLPKLGFYYIFSKPAIQWMLNLKHSIYPRFSPNDMAVRIMASQVNDLYNSKMLIFREWSPLAKKLVNQHKDFLLQEKSI